MFTFAAAARLPVPVTLARPDGSTLELSVPLMRLADWNDIAAIEQARRADAATRGMDPATRFKYLSLYPVVPLEYEELRSLSRTPQYGGKILRTCLARCPQAPQDDEGVRKAWVEQTAQQIEEAAASLEHMETLVEFLSAWRIPKLPDPQPKAQPQQQQQQQGQTPTTNPSAEFERKNDESTFASEGPKKQPDPLPPA